MSDTSLIKICNGNIITPYRIIPRGTLLIAGNKIIAVSDRDIEIEEGTTIDAGGCYIAPGFIDIHVHGGGGYDFMDGTEEAFLTIAETHARFGTTSIFPTTLTADIDSLINTLTVYEQVRLKNTSGAELMGIHLEGPYFAVNQRGAQDPRFIHPPDEAEYKKIVEQFPSIARWSSAPELDGAIGLGLFLKKKNILPAIAHTDAVYEQVIEAFENGYKLATHLYSGMSGVTRKNAMRYAGVIESALQIDELDVEIIADGVHLPSPLLKLVYQVKGPGRIALITDAMRAAGTDVTNSILGSLNGGLPVIVEDGVAKLPDRSSFAGSIATTDRLVRTMVEQAGVNITDAIRMMTSTPARIMNIDHQKGSLTRGKDADVIIMDEHINVKMTIVGGKIVYAGEKPFTNRTSPRLI